MIIKKKDCEWQNYILVPLVIRFRFRLFIFFTKFSNKESTLKCDEHTNI